MIRAVLLDLDDTLYPQVDWLAGAWEAVAAAAPEVDGLLAALHEVAAEGSDRGRIIDRALARAGAAGVAVAPLVQAFRSHVAPVLDPYPGAIEALRSLEVPVGLVTDGDVEIQRGKLQALGLRHAFDVVVLSDALGRERRKPHPAPFESALALLRVAPQHAVMIGDRPEKDVAGAIAAGMLSVRVRTGEYAGLPDDPQPWRTAPDVAAALELVRPLCQPVAASMPSEPIAASATS